LIGRYQRKDNTLFDVILTKSRGKEYYEMGNVGNPFHNRIYEKVTVELLKQLLKSGEIKGLNHANTNLNNS